MALPSGLLSPPLLPAPTTCNTHRCLYEMSTPSTGTTG
jgi:hypothetical protein